METNGTSKYLTPKETRNLSQSSFFLFSLQTSKSGEEGIVVESLLLLRREGFPSYLGLSVPRDLTETFPYREGRCRVRTHNDGEVTDQ